MSTPKIGLEVHTQLNTTTKLFCTCLTKGDDQPNTRTCVVCLGHPGSKPVLNKKAFQQGVKIALALGCTITTTMHFSRKTYYYPDLAKNYQITQYETPIGTQGSITLDSGKTIHITRVHIEEDPAALEHHETYCLADYNRSGIPLAEIVTEPEFSNPEEAREFLNKLTTILTYLGTYESEGVIKADANVSIKEKNYTRVEIKNITGFKEIARAITYEIKRQEEHEVVRETRAWNAEKGITTSMRSKETEEDYGYITDPDLPTIELSLQEIEEIKSTLPELSEAKISRYVKQFKIDYTDAKIIANDLQLAQAFEKLIIKHDPMLTAKWVRRDLLRSLALAEKNITEINLNYVSELLIMIASKEITDYVAQQLMTILVKENKSPKQIAQQQSLKRISNTLSIKGFCEDTIKENHEAVADYHSGKKEALDFLLGQVMKKTKGAAAPEIVKQEIKNILAK